MMFQFSQVFLQSSHVLKWGGKIVFGMVPCTTVVMLALALYCHILRHKK